MLYVDPVVHAVLLLKDNAISSHQIKGKGVVGPGSRACSSLMWSLGEKVTVGLLIPQHFLFSQYTIHQ